MISFSSQLLTWFDQNGRKSLPWQAEKTPYRVWVSEIMLQQTQVATVIPYFIKFIERFPTIDELAAASEDEVLHQWSGLGYYARARNLQATAKEILDRHNGEFPSRVEELEALPGIGRSTAGAIVAICNGTYAPILDGNVKRVLARHFAIAGWPGQTKTQKLLWAKAESLTPHKRVADYTQGIMDLGATVCTRSSPKCKSCPYLKTCKAYADGTVDRYPGKKPKTLKPIKNTVMLVAESNNELLLKKRPSNGIWGGLWTFPECQSIDDLGLLIESLNLEVNEQTPLNKFRHTFSHYHLDIIPVKVIVTHIKNIPNTSSYIWFNVDSPQIIGIAKPVLKILDDLRSD